MGVHLCVHTYAYMHVLCVHGCTYVRVQAAPAPASLEMFVVTESA